MTVGDIRGVPMDFADRVAIVTGAAGGIGGAVVRLFLSAGAAVLATDVDADAGKALLDELDAGDQIEFVAADVTDEEHVVGVVDAAVQRFGRLDFAHNNVGINGPVAPIDKYSSDDWHRMLAINLTSVFYGLKHEIPAIRASGTGAIVNTSSYAGLVAVPWLSGYVATKHGVIGLTKTAALEYGHKGVRVNTVCPGSTDTPMIQDYHQGDDRLLDAIKNLSPMGRLADPAEIAAAVVWLCSDHASFVNGHALSVDGGAVIR
jgi:NAD(P)-dependent dehydrogenase (short-subunit alcohol dehydrogenase family)